MSLSFNKCSTCIVLIIETLGVRPNVFLSLLAAASTVEKLINGSSLYSCVQLYTTAIFRNKLTS